MKHVIIFTLCMALAFTAGWVSSRSVTLKQYPPDTVEYLTELKAYLAPMSKEEIADTAHTMQKNLKIISSEFDYQALYEGMSAQYFQLALERGGESEAKELVDKQLQKFQDRYNQGLSLPESSMKLATTLSETIQKY